MQYTLNFVPTTTNVQAIRGRKYERVSLLYNPPTDWDKSSAEWSKMFGIKMITMMFASQFVQVYRRNDVKATLELSMNFTSQHYVYRLTHVYKINKS